MSGSFDVDPADSLGFAASPVVVCRFDGANYEPLGNVVCDGIRWSAGPEPPVARMHYLLDVIAEASGYPTDFEDLWPLDAKGTGVVQPDDRLVVLTYSPFGDVEVLFDGHAQVPQVDVSPTSQAVNFVAVGVHARCFDLPVGGRLQRDSSLPNVDGSPIQTDLPTKFNPYTHEGKTKPNCTPASHDELQGDDKVSYPVFLDELLRRTPDPRRSWTLPLAVKYLAAVWNDQKWAKNPDFTGLDDLLQARFPIDGSDTVNPADSSAFQGADIVIRDYDATQKGWPEAVAELVGRSGFGFRWRTQTDENGLPYNDWWVYRLDAGQPWAPRSLWLQASPATVLDGIDTAASLHLSRDINGLVNAFSVETPPRRVETSIVLAPGYTPAAGDEAPAAARAFLSSNLGDATTTVRDKYRLYVADECGDGHWDFETAAIVTSTLDLSPIFPNDEKKNPTYVKRMRPGSLHLITLDATGKRRKAVLHVSRDYAGDVPAVWDGTGTWQEISGGWTHLEDRLGIRVSIENPEAWPIGESSTQTQEQSKTLRGITSMAAPADPNTRFYLRLTTVIDDDIMLPAVVGARVASPTKFTRRRRVDARDHFLLETISQTSALCVTPIGTSGAKDVIQRDDTDRALAHARQLRAAHEMPTLAGSATIPFLTTAFAPGDRIKLIRGRDASLRSNAGADHGEAPTYPTVVALDWSFAGESQTTTLQLSDRRAEPAKA